LIGHENGRGWSDSAKFPVIFPVSREFGAETGSHLTASSGWQDSNLRVRYFGTGGLMASRSFIVKKF
jgi:hypothetical protein